MPQQKITIENKSTGDQLTAEEFNSIKSVINNNADVTTDKTIQLYTTEELPRNASNGKIAFDTTISTLVYFFDGKWYKVSDDTLVIDLTTELEVYLFSGQSNAGGTTTDGVGDLSNFQQLDGDGSTLADEQINVLIQNNYGSNNLAPQTLKIGNYQGGSHGIEVSFLDGISHVRSAKKPMIVKYTSGGSKIETWSKANSNAENSSNPINNWDRLIDSVNYTIQWATENHYTLDWKGFIWWQGESDKGRVPSEHQADLEVLISNVRSSLSKPELPVCLIQTDNRTADNAEGTNSVRTEGTDNIRQAHTDTANDDAYVELIETESYIEFFEWQTSNNTEWHGVHWQTEAHVPIGYDTATRMNQLIEGSLEWEMPQSVLWLDADDSSTVTHSDSAQQKVSEWRDKSGNNYHVQQATGWRQPTYNLTPINGKNTMQFETARQFTSTVPDPADFRDVYIVAQWEGADPFTHSSDSYKVLFSGAEYNDANQGIQTGQDNRKLYYNNPFYDEIIMNGTMHNINDDILDELKVPFCMNVRCNSYKPLDGFSISRDRSLDGREWKGRIAEIICFNSKLSDDERHGVEGYLAHKWGLSDKLPTDHPYKNSAP